MTDEMNNNSDAAASPLDITALSYWFPKLEAAGLPVPKTKMLAMPRAAQEDIWAGFDGKNGTGALLPFLADLKAIAGEIGFPCFLRTDMTSGKHGWERTCFVKSADDIGSHVFAIAEYSEMADLIGIPWSNWVVREFLPTIPLGVCPDFGNMPICREFRFFVDGPVVKCSHPYWPRHALEQGGAQMQDAEYDALCHMSREETAELNLLAAAVGDYIGGTWSVDLLETKRGWFVTDMAEASKSFHWKGCANEGVFRKAKGTLLRPNPNHSGAP